MEQPGPLAGLDLGSAEAAELAWLAGGYPGKSANASSSAVLSGSAAASSSRATNGSAGGGKGSGATSEPSEADILCSEFLGLVQQKTKEGYEEALRLSEKILDLEPGNRIVHEYQAVIRMFLKSMEERVKEAEDDARDPNRTPSEVSTESDSPEEAGEEGADEPGDVSEVETEGPASATHTPRRG
mmetsp:Transcript_113062/g.200453  ORF Transcript_113062/g.200453 Transcript_113062/m.200453 type:complete len:185 (+) Transcript_113062:75-629(+)